MSAKNEHTDENGGTDMSEDLLARVTQVMEVIPRVDTLISSTLDPIEEARRDLREARSALQAAVREIEAHEARLDRISDASRLRKRPGRPAGSKSSSARTREPAAA